MPILNVARICLCYERQGRGHPLLFISGLGADHALWTPVVALLKDRYRCITFDNRGIGQSSRPRSGYTATQLARDTAGLLRRLGIPQAHVLGMSMGGLVAQTMALQWPETVASLVLVGSFARADARLMHVLNSRKVMQRQMARYDYFHALAAWMFGPDALARPGFADAFARRAAENPYPQALHAFDQLVDGIGQFDSRPLLKNVRKPTLVMVGEQDILTPPYLSQELARRVRGARLEVLPGLGHFCAVEDPAGFAERVHWFLAC
ncbi:MAG: alpha/beta fold hydrolase [Chloroflexi bacterium]|nr:alpha/beta fold hydrolase [Chloroflexota bacterium]